MSSKHSLKTCCVIKCVNINTPLKSEVNFFEFPDPRLRSFQRDKWVQAVKSNNGPWWLPSAHSLICSDHFVKGKPNDCPMDEDYAPSVFVNVEKPELKSRKLSVKEFAMEYIQHNALLEKPSESNMNTDQRRLAYLKLAAALLIPVQTVRSFEKRFREYYEQKMAESAQKQKEGGGMKPQWLNKVTKRLGGHFEPRISVLGGTGTLAAGAGLAPAGTVSPGGVVAALCAAARARGTLCSTALYNDVRRALRLSAGVNDLHAVWVSVQRVSLEQVLVAARAGDAAPASHTAAVADLVLLHTDVDMHRLITDESVTLYEESAALHTLWQLVQRHQLGDAAPMDTRVRAQRWTRAHRDYLDSGRNASLVVLQRRWHELKLQARVRLAAHWRRRDPAPPPAPPAAPGPPVPAPRDLYPRPAPIHIAILKRYPHVATGAFKSWRQLVLDGAIVTESLEEDKNTEENEGEGKKQSETNEPLQPDNKVIEPKTEKPAVDEPEVEKTAGSEPADENNSVDEPLADETTNNDEKVNEPSVVETKCKPLLKQTTTGDPLPEKLTAEQPSVDEPIHTDMLGEHNASNDILAVKPTVNELKIEQNTANNLAPEQPLADEPADTDMLGEQIASDNSLTVNATVNQLKVEQNTANNLTSEQPPAGEPADTDMLDEHIASDDSLAVNATVNELKVLQNTVNNLTSEQPAVDELMDTDMLGEQSISEDSPTVKPTVNELKVEQNMVTDPVVGSPEAAQLTVKDFQAVHAALDAPMDICDALEEVDATDDLKTGAPAVNEIKVEQNMVNDSSADDLATERPPANDLLVVPPEIFNRMYNNLLDKQGPGDSQSLLKEPKVEQAINKNALAVHPVTEETTNSALLDEQPSVDGPEVVQTTENDLLVGQSKVDNPLPKKSQNSVLLALLTAGSKNLEMKSTSSFSKTKQFMDSLKKQGLMSGPSVQSIGQLAGGAICPDVLARQERLQSSSELIHHDEDKSNTDSEDNLVIDECSNNTLCLFQPEPMANTETRGADTASPHTTLENVAPTIQVLQMLDPSTVKKEILFESDEEDSQPCVEENKVDIDVKKEVSVMANKIVFVNEELGVSSGVKTENDTEQRIDGDESQEEDDIDHKLLMDTKVLLLKIDKTRAWKNNVRKDNSIRVSRIHRRFYTPSAKKYYYTPMSNNKTKTGNRKSQPKTRNSTSNSNDQTNSQEIKIDDSCLEQVANTHSVRQLCRNIKREMTGEALEDKTPKKRVKTLSESDDNPLQTMKETEIQESEKQTETADASAEKELIEVLSSDDELMNDELILNLDREDKRRGKAPTRAASSIEWSSRFTPVFGGRVSKRVTLPDRAQLRRETRGPRVAQVAPISTHADTTETNTKDSTPVETPGDPGDDDTPFAWRALDLPTDDQLDAALDELTTACSVEQVLERAQCCAARRHREVNDTRRRIGVPDLPLHTHEDGVCTCCCAHLSDSDARSRLDVQLRALHHDIERMLLLVRKKKQKKAYQKTALGRSQSNPAQKRPRSPSPAATNTLKPSSKDTPLNSTAEAVSSKSKPLLTEAKVAKGKPATYTNRYKKRRLKRAPPVAEPAPIVDYYEEWQRQKNMNAQYFQFKGNSSSKKNKTKPPQSVAQRSTPQSMIQSGKPRAVLLGTIPLSVAQSPAPQTVIQSTTPQNVVLTTTPQNVVLTTTPQNVVQSTVAHSMTPLRNTSTGLMPYIRESRLIAPVISPATHTIEVPTLVPVIFPRVQSSVLVKKPEKRATPPQVPKTIQVPRTTPRTIAPKPEGMRRASEAQNKAVEEAPVEPQPTNPYTYQTSQPRRMNLTTQQVAEPQPSTSEPVVKPVSILEEYSRTLSAGPRTMPVVNALSLRVPDGPEGPKTTIVMALNLPSDNVIKQTINTLCANDTVDLTNEPDTSVVTKPPEAQKTIQPVCDIVGVVKGLITAGNKALKPSNTPASKSLLKVDLETQSEAPQSRKHTPKIMSLTKSLHDGDVIEIDDTDSNSDDNSNGSHSSKSNSSTAMSKTSDPTLYCNEKLVCSNVPVVCDNKSSKIAEPSNTKTVSPSTDVRSSEAKNSIQTKSNNSNSLLQTTGGAADEVLNQTVATDINESVNKNESSDTKNIMKTTSDPDAPVSGHFVRLSNLISNIRNNYQTNFNLNKSTSKAPWNTKNIEAYNKPTSSIQTVPTNKSANTMTYSKIAATSNTNKNTKSVNKTTSNQSTSKRKTSNQSVSKRRTSNQSISQTTTSNQSVSQTTASKQSTTNKNTTKDVSEDTSGNPAVGRVAPAVKKASRSKTPQTRYRWHSMVEALTDYSEDPAYSGIQTLKSLIVDRQRCPARFADARSMPDFVAKLRTSIDKNGYCHKPSAPEVSVSALACGATLLCVDAASPPLVLKTQNEPLYKSMPHFRAHLVLTDADLPCKQPTYWTLASYRLLSRVVPDAADVPGVPDAPAGPAVASGGGGAQWCPEKGEWVMRKEDRQICDKNHSFKVLTAFCTADGVRQAARAGATLFLLNVLRARVLVLSIERVPQPGGARHTYRAAADVEPEILRNLESLIDKAELEEQQSGRTNIIG